MCCKSMDKRMDKRMDETRLALVLVVMLSMAIGPVFAAPGAEPDSGADAVKRAGGGTETVTEESAAEPVYRPPRRGAPKTRVGGGTREAGTDVAPSIALLAPLSTGFTTRASPVLYWYLSSAYEGRFEFVVAERSRRVVEPLFRQVVDGRYAAGYHAFDLGALDVALAEDRVYQWSVAIVRDPERRSHDIVAVATVERVAETRTQRPEQSTVTGLAGAGLWYDAIEALGPPPSSATARNQLAALLRQVGLAQVRADG